MGASTSEPTIEATQWRIVNSTENGKWPENLLQVRIRFISHYFFYVNFVIKTSLSCWFILVSLVPLKHLCNATLFVCLASFSNILHMEAKKLARLTLPHRAHMLLGKMKVCTVKTQKFPNVVHLTVTVTLSTFAAPIQLPPSAHIFSSQCNAYSLLAINSHYPHLPHHFVIHASQPTSSVVSATLTVHWQSTTTTHSYYPQLPHHFVIHAINWLEGDMYIAHNAPLIFSCNENWPKMYFIAPM